MFAADPRGVLSQKIGIENQKMSSESQLALAEKFKKDRYKKKLLQMIWILRGFFLIFPHFFKKKISVNIWTCRQHVCEKYI